VDQTPSKLWYDDLAPGQRYHARTPYRMTEAAIIAFAREFDPQPNHCDPAAARASLFEGLAASGWHTAAATMRLLTEAGFPVGNGVVGAGVDIAWPTPTRPGDELTLELVVKAKRLSRTKPDRGVVVVEYDTRNQLGEVRQRTRTTLIVLRDPARSGAAAG
jgi:acyl dehydratase